MAGAVVSTTVTVWLHVALLVQQSMASQVRVIVVGQLPFVTVWSRETVNSAPQQELNAEGSSKLQALPHSTALSAAQVICGGAVFCTVTVWVVVNWSPQLVVTRQARVIRCGQVPLVTVLITTAAPAPVHAGSEGDEGPTGGGSNVHSVPQSTVLFVGASKVGAVPFRFTQFEPMLPGPGPN